MATLREFSRAGPCITLGTIVKDGDKSWRITDHEGKQRVVAKSSYRARVGLIHAEPCVSCRDHEKTQYPDGYMD